MERLKSILKVPAVVTVTDNTRSMISVRRRDHAYHVRLHHLFLDADEGIIQALADYISGNTGRAIRIIREFIREHRSKIRAKAIPKARNVNIRHQGRHFNLLDSFHALNEGYFGGSISSSITWGKRVGHRRGSSIRLGSYSPSSNIIRINPALDRDFVPNYVLDAIIYHERLHRHLGFQYAGGRRLSHYARFKELERGFVHYERARLWIKNNLPLLTGKS
jgi:hypothetical protein